MTRISHQKMFQWLLENLHRAKRNAPVGWKDGPDSGIWPSDNPDDYKQIFQLFNFNSIL